MKYLVVFNLIVAICFVQAQTPEQVENLKRHNEECSKQITIDPQLVVNARQGTFSEEQVLKDYLFCVAKRAGFISDNGDLQRDILLAQTSIAAGNDNDARKLVDACAVQQNNGPDTTLHVARCYFERSPQHINIL